MKKLLAIITIFYTLLFPVAIALSATTYAVDVFPACSTNTQLSTSSVCRDVNNSNSQNPVINTISAAINILSYVVGVAAVIGLIVNGLRMIVSNGDSNAIASSRSGILYSLIGVAVTILAQIMVIFVLDKIK